MKSARRQKRIHNKEVRRKKLPFLKILIPVLVFVLLFLFFKLTTNYWDGKSKVSFVFQTSKGDIGVTILDPLLAEKTILIIPGDTQVDVARGYGTLRIKNVWQLGVNEKLGGGLLSQTITDSFLFPTTLWSEKNLDNIWQFIFTNNKTNIKFGDRLQIALFALKVKSIDKTEIDLGKNQFLKKETLIDGAPGYIQNGPVSGRLTVYFSDNNFSDKNLKFGIVDSTGKPGVANGVGSILEILGGKVVSLERQQLKDSDCEVLGQNKDAVKKVATLFSCKIISGQSGLDLEMRIGSSFAKRY